MNSTKLAIIAVLAALSIGTNYAMISFYNVKFMDLIVFIGGFCFGPIVGVLTGIISWAVYGTLNPAGFSLLVWFSTMFSEAIYGVAGALIRRSLLLGETSRLKDNAAEAGLFFGMVGMLLTFAYDVITNIVFGYVFGWSILFAIVAGFVPFGLVHVISNTFFFGLGCVPTIYVIHSFIGGKGHSLVQK